MTSSGLEHATFRLVAQSLNQVRYRVSPNTDDKKLNNECYHLLGYSPYVNRCFGSTYHLHLLDRKSAEQETSVQQVARLVANGLHGAMSQKMATFITTVQILQIE
jgi:hypothetical protein